MTLIRHVYQRLSSPTEMWCIENFLQYPPDEVVCTFPWSLVSRVRDARCLIAAPVVVMSAPLRTAKYTHFGSQSIMQSNTQYRFQIFTI
ncbi:unnamed protein product [Allacma fusca]|uniref:Uncharacterized protein n=1 Tax=Allacma fusca TaxID=39272 RepID=A0A8J2P0Y7_9HEXA|nr:unnamed protein product [Allacma fusca]